LIGIRENFAQQPQPIMPPHPVFGQPNNTGAFLTAVL
jgi:hypothetical protein